MSAKITDDARHTDAGETLIELLISIAILGIAVIAILGSIAMSASSSSIHRAQAQSQNVLRNWAEDISNFSPYTACATKTTFASATPALSGAKYTGYVPTVNSVKVWNGSAFSPDGTCPAGGDKGVQLVTLQLKLPDFPTPQTLDVVVRKPCETLPC